MLLLDYNEDLTINTSQIETRIEEVARETLNFDTRVENKQGSSAKIHINLLSPFVGFGGGSYTMTVVKRMTAKDDFVTMPLMNKKCEVESYEDCRTRRLLNECNCVPWELSGFQVMYLFLDCIHL